VVEMTNASEPYTASSTSSSNMVALSAASILPCVLAQAPASGRRGPHGPRPPTPPDVRFRIRRFT
jgi:hypothetical protein